MKSNVVIIQLGAPNEVNGELSSIAKSRTHITVTLAQQFDEAQIICTGGFGQFNQSTMPHGEWVKRSLVANGIDAHRFLAVPLSRFTIEDASLSVPIVAAGEFDKLLLVTSDFHCKRAVMIFRHYFPDIEIECHRAITDSLAFPRLVQHELLAYQRDFNTLNLPISSS
jgi:uncharacterized SAM-binding protein YcdF (DUF218 family)